MADHLAQELGNIFPRTHDRYVHSDQDISLSSDIMSHEVLLKCLQLYGANLRNAENLDRFLDTIIELAQPYLPQIMIQIYFTHCGICQGFIGDPVTLSCGDTFMKSCIKIDEEDEIWLCPSCDREHNINSISNLKQSVAVTTLLEKLWNKQLKSAKAYQEGNRILAEGNTAEAIQRYSYAIELDPTNHLAFASRSDAYLSIGQTVAALRDADVVTELSPQWAMGYFHRGLALTALGQLEEAAVSFLHSNILDCNFVDARIEARKLLNKIVFASLLCQNDPLPFRASSALCLSQLTGSQTSLNGGDSSDSICCKRDDDDDSEDEENSRVVSLGDKSLQIPMHLRELLCRLLYDLKKKSLSTKSPMHLQIDSNLIDKLDLECSLCMRLLFEPVTTPCGHTFCRTCLDRCFDHSTSCPLCKTMLLPFISEKRQVTKFIDYAIQTLFPEDYSERKRVYIEEMEELANGGKDLEHLIPLFICTVAYPTVPCPLHVFEPRYRLMIRQCVESGTNQFGMCAFVNDQDDGISDVGTMLEIRNVRLLPDGRSILDTIGRRRFQILKKGMRDGYNTGAITILRDEPVTDEELTETIQIHTTTRKAAISWFSKLPPITRERILTHFGPMPPVETNFLTSPDGPAWIWWMLAILPLESRNQLQILKMTKLHRRLDTLHRILLHLQSRNFL